MERQAKLFRRMGINLIRLHTVRSAMGALIIPEEGDAAGTPTSGDAGPAAAGDSDSGGCDCDASGSDMPTPWVWALVVLALWRRPRRHA